MAALLLFLYLWETPGGMGCIFYLRTPGGPEFLWMPAAGQILENQPPCRRPGGGVSVP